MCFFLKYHYLEVTKWDQQDMWIRGSKGFYAHALLSLLSNPGILGSTMILLSLHYLKGCQAISQNWRNRIQLHCCFVSTQTKTWHKHFIFLLSHPCLLWIIFFPQHHSLSVFFLSAPAQNWTVDIIFTCSRKIIKHGFPRIMDFPSKHKGIGDII